MGRRRQQYVTAQEFLAEDAARSRAMSRAWAVTVAGQLRSNSRHAWRLNEPDAADLGLLADMVAAAPPLPGKPAGWLDSAAAYAGVRFPDPRDGSLFVVAGGGALGWFARSGSELQPRFAVDTGFAVEAAVLELIRADDHGAAVLASIGAVPGRAAGRVRLRRARQRTWYGRRLDRSRPSTG